MSNKPATWMNHWEPMYHPVPDEMVAPLQHVFSLVAFYGSEDVREQAQGLIWGQGPVDGLSSSAGHEFCDRAARTLASVEILVDLRHRRIAKRHDFAMLAAYAAERLSEDRSDQASGQAGIHAQSPEQVQRTGEAAREIDMSRRAAAFLLGLEQVGHSHGLSVAA